MSLFLKTLPTNWPSSVLNIATQLPFAICPYTIRRSRLSQMLCHTTRTAIMTGILRCMYRLTSPAAALHLYCGHSLPMWYDVYLAAPHSHDHTTLVHALQEPAVSCSYPVETPLRVSRDVMSTVIYLMDTMSNTVVNNVL